ncbi:hypothetical protein DB345_04240 [Spartobacteria bacterium LR76]|nr:hypothetical protein DB345_04240 [Spartobacteria bacterium LR76]
MKPLFLPGFLAVGLMLTPIAHAQDAPPVNADAILRELDTIEQRQKQTLASARQMAISQLRSAAVSPSAAAALYADAVEAVDFEGKPNKGAAFADWKSGMGDALRSSDFQTVILLHLRYLVLSLERAGSDKPELFISPSLAYANDLIQTENSFLDLKKKQAEKPANERAQRDKEITQKVLNAKKDLLDKSISDGVFTRWLRLQQWLPKGDTWELTPGNLAGILEKNVRTVMRTVKDPGLVQTWDLEMKVLADRATSGRLDFLAADFNTMVRPKMIFSRANDMILLGQTNRAANDIYILVKTYPQHPDFSKWVVKLREILKPAAPAEAAAPQSVSTPGTNP